MSISPKVRHGLGNDHPLGKIGFYYCTVGGDFSGNTYF